MNKKQIILSIIKAKSLEEGVVEGIIATSSVDRQGEKLDLKGLDIKTYMETSGVVLYGHDYFSLPIGKTLSLRKRADQLIAQFKLAVDISPLARQVYDMILGDFVKGLSVGFMGIEWDEETNTWTKSEMLEFSIVPVPANSEALITAKSKGIETNLLENFAEDKGVIGFKETPKADKALIWDGPMQIRECGDDIQKIKAISAWFDSENPDIKSSYKLPHHLAVGEHAVVWNGVKAAMGALMGARGGVDIPDEDRKGVYNHLAKHYKQFDEEAPEFKSFDEIQSEEKSEYENLSSQISALTEQVSALGTTISSIVTDKGVGTVRKRRLVVTAKKNAQIVDKQVELVIAALKKNLSAGTDN